MKRVSPTFNFKACSCLTEAEAIGTCVLLPLVEKGVHLTCEYVLAAVLNASKTFFSVFTVSGLLAAADREQQKNFMCTNDSAA